jgi:hypothetical protein
MSEGLGASWRRWSLTVKAFSGRRPGMTVGAKLPNSDRIMADGQLVGVRVERGDPGSFGPEPGIARRPACHEQAGIR